MKTFILFAAGICICAGSAVGDVQTFENDYDGFVEAAGPLSVIDFETLPNGEPSVAGVEITEDFNYDMQGAHFAAPTPYPVIAGNSPFGLLAFNSSEDTWIIAELTTPAFAVGGFYGGTTLLCAYDESGEELGCVFYSDPGELNFVGIVSDVPIHSAIFDRDSNLAAIEDFRFSPVPEPGTLALLASSAVLGFVDDDEIAGPALNREAYCAAGSNDDLWRRARPPG